MNQNDSYNEKMRLIDLKATVTNNNASTIDTLIEKERDNQLIERLDKQNRINLKGNNFLQRQKSLVNQTECDFVQVESSNTIAAGNYS